MGDNIDQYEEDDMMEESIKAPYKPKKVNAKRKMEYIVTQCLQIQVRLICALFVMLVG